MALAACICLRPSVILHCASHANLSLISLFILAAFAHADHVDSFPLSQLKINPWVQITEAHSGDNYDHLGLYLGCDDFEEAAKSCSSVRF